jgi:hypothetical protein
LRDQNQKIKRLGLKLNLTNISKVILPIILLLINYRPRTKLLPQGGEQSAHVFIANNTKFKHCSPRAMGFYFFFPPKSLV